VSGEIPYEKKKKGKVSSGDGCGGKKRVRLKKNRRGTKAKGHQGQGVSGEKMRKLEGKISIFNVYTVRCKGGHGVGGNKGELRPAYGK